MTTTSSSRPTSSRSCRRACELARSGNVSTVSMTRVIRPDGMITRSRSVKSWSPARRPARSPDHRQKLSELYKFTGDYPSMSRNRRQVLLHPRPGACYPAPIFTGRETTPLGVAKANPNVGPGKRLSVIRLRWTSTSGRIFELDFKDDRARRHEQERPPPGGDIIYVPPTILAPSV